MKLSKFFSVCAVSVGMLGVYVCPAYATLVSGDHDGLSSESIQCSEGSLTLQVPVHEDGHVDKNGLSYPSPAGYAFTVSRVSDIDLSDDASWLEYEDLMPADLGKHTVVKVGAQTTGVDGRVVFAGLPVGVYLVHGVLPEGSPKYASVADFVVSVPIGHDNVFWDCDPVVNTKVSLTPPVPPVPPEVVPPMPKPPVPAPPSPVDPLAHTGVTVAYLGLGGGVVLVVGGLLLARSRSRKGQVR